MTKIKVNIITGFLGSGKTSLIINLLKNKPKDEKWTILVNEFGDVPIDGSIIDSSENNISIKEVSGGCMCCVGKLLFDVALAQVVGTLKPDRLIIEPSGLGHINQIIKTLKNATYEKICHTHSPICLVDARNLNQKEIIENPIFKEQIEISGILLASKTDILNKDEKELFKNYIKNINPPKQATSFISDSKMDFEFLNYNLPFIDIIEKPIITGIFEDKKSHNEEIEKPLKGKPVIKITDIGDFTGIGFIFSDEDIFDKNKIILWAHQQEKMIRLKAIFQLDQESILINKTLYELSINPHQNRKNNSIEIIYHKSQSINKDKILTSIQNCLK